MNKPENVNLFFDTKGKRMEIQVAPTSGKWKFFTAGKKRYVHWNNKKILLKMANVAGVSLSNMMNKNLKELILTVKMWLFLNLRKWEQSGRKIFRQGSKRLPFLSEKSASLLL